VSYCACFPYIRVPLLSVGGRHAEEIAGVRAFIGTVSLDMLTE